ncbi:MAG TPA: TonB-dependent receptor [Terracidiphilus sp.]|nr:TonB-dependent receptor [Terracidiphilus sp.]
MQIVITKKQLSTKSLAVLVLFLTAVSFSKAQAGLGSLAGTVTDSTHAVVAGATVTLSNDATGFVATQITANTGSFRFFALEITGGYELKVSAKGFKTVDIQNLSTSVGTVLTQDVTLPVGATVDTVEVTSSENVEQVQTETAAISELIDSQIWQSSPLEERTQNAFVNLTAGATPDSGTGRGSAVDGARTGTGNFLVDGMDNNDQGLGGGNAVGGGGAVTTISPDAIQEYRVISHDVPAEYGRAGGFATDTVLKSGTEKWHGSLFEYNRIQALAADDYFSKRAGIEDHLVRNQFGGSVGGKIYKDKTFFYATVEIHHRRQSTPTTGVVTTPDFLNFVKSGAFETFMEGTTQQDSSTGQIGLCPAYFGAPCPGALSDAATLGPIFQTLLAAEPTAYPLDTQNGTNVAAGLYTGGAVIYPVNIYATTTKSDTDALNQNRGSLKIDHKLTDSDQLSFAYLADLYLDQNSDEAGTSAFGPPGQDVGGAQNFSTTWTHTFSPTMLNIFRAGYLRHVSNFTEPGTEGVPEIFAADPTYTGFGAADNIPQLFTENEFLYEDSLTKTISRHAFKTGFKYIRTRNGSSFFADMNGTLGVWDTENLLTDAQLYDQFEMYSYNTYGAYPYGAPYGSIYTASAAWDTTDNTMPNFYRGYRANEFAAYVQDDWKVNGRLTLNLGVRWDYFGPPHNFQPGYDSNVYFGTFGTPTPTGNPFVPQTSLAGAEQSANFVQKNSNIWNKDTSAIGPHVGFSYDVTGTGKLAIRGGYSIGYDRLYNNVYENIRFNYPKYSDNAIGYGTSVVAGALYEPGLYEVPFTGNSLFSAWGAKPVPRHVDQRLKDAYYEQISFGYEYQVHPGYVWEVNYVGTLGRQLVGLDNINTFAGRDACPPGTYNPSSPCGAAGYPNGFATTRLNTTFNNDNFRTNGFNSNYNGFETSLRKGYANGLQFMANYTYSKALDEISDVFTVRTALTGTTDPYNKAYDYGPADFDMRQNFTLTMNYQEQWKKKNMLLGGWGVSPIVFMHSGTPFSVYDSAGSYNPIEDGRTGDRAVYAGSGTPKNAITHSQTPALGYLKPGSYAAYTCPSGKLWCDPPAERNALTGPAYKDLDLGILKRFPINERSGFTLEGNFFNFFNHTNFGNPVTDINSGDFGLSLGDAQPRITQLSLRYDF